MAELDRDVGAVGEDAAERHTVHGEQYSAVFDFLGDHCERSLRQVADRLDQSVAVLADEPQFFKQCVNGLCRHLRLHKRVTTTVPRDVIARGVLPILTAGDQDAIPTENGAKTLRKRKSAATPPAVTA
ncbi:MAG: hypothetical protein ACRC1K_03020 [Planctomycetia bacterium]